MGTTDNTFQSLQKIKLQNIDIADIGQKLILSQINGLRSLVNLKAGDDNSGSINTSSIFPPLPESYCHTFYRILGLPVIHSNQTSFYNPGFYGVQDTSDELVRRQNIDMSQDPVLVMSEIMRERNANDNLLAFNNAETKINYRLDMMLAPIPTLLMSPNANAFDQDKQTIDSLPNRQTFKKVSKILRPFKCTPSITNNIHPITNRICAPFIITNDAKVFNTALSSSYLEFVARIRFSCDVYATGTSNLYQSLVAQMKNISVNGQNILEDFLYEITTLSDTETYIFSQLFLSFLSICSNVKELIKTNSALAQQIYTQIYLTGGTVSTTNQGEIQLGSIDAQIAAKKQLKAEKSMILAQLPVGKEFIDGVQLQNPLNCVTNHTFISLVQGDLKAIDDQIQQLGQQKNNQLILFNNINDISFYVLGEVNGIGLIDIIALLMSFWLLPQDQLLSMFDESSFNRLYMETELRNTVVEARKSSHTTIPISKVMASMDKNVFNLIKVASGIIDGSTSS